MGSCASLYFWLPSGAPQLGGFQEKTAGLDNVELRWTGFSDSMVPFVTGIMERVKNMRDEDAQGKLESLFN